jgi:CPA2 family monovalent cation:H+ antiporter-2
MMVFFLSIGLLIDLDYVRENLGSVLLLLLMVAGFKTVLNVAILRVLNQSWQNAFLTGIVLAQIGEFSFLIAVTALDAGVIDEGLHRLIVSVAALSLSLSPLWVILARRLQSLTSAGITSGSELLRGVCEPETELVAETIEGARWRGRRLARALSALRRSRGTDRKVLVTEQPPPAEGSDEPVAEPEPSRDA